MKHLQITDTPVSLNPGDYKLIGTPVIDQVRKFKDLSGIFWNREAFEKMKPEQVVYQVQAWMPVKEGTEGGLFFGATNIFPGKVGNEYFMTKGHFHTLSDRAEFYWGVQGEGMLILMDQERNTWAERMHQGSLHYIPAHVAHRVANTGNTKLIFGACWPSDAGHNYEEIAKNGFSARLIEKDGNPILREL